MNGAYAYLRISGRGQADRDGLPRQRDAIEIFADRSDCSIQGEFKDVLSRTTKTEDRPGFEDMIRAINGGDVRTIIIERIDRLGGMMAVVESTILWLVSQEISLIVADTGENVTEAYKSDPMKAALVDMQAVFSKLDRAMLVKKLKIARDRIRKETGRCEGRKPYGYRPGEDATIKRIKNLRHKRKGLPKPGPSWIAAILQIEGFPTRDGGIWRHQTVANIIKRFRKRGYPTNKSIKN